MPGSPSRIHFSISRFVIIDILMKMNHFIVMVYVDVSQTNQIEISERWRQKAMKLTCKKPFELLENCHD